MNFCGFPAKEVHDLALLIVLEKVFKDFFKKQVSANSRKVECLLSTLIRRLLTDRKCTAKVLKNIKDYWFGATYKEDIAAVAESFKKLVVDKVYWEVFVKLNMNFG